MTANLRRSLLRLRNAFRPAAADSELGRELNAHLALLEDDYVGRGLTREAARLQARRAFGGVEQAKERHRDARSFVWLDDALRDVRHAVRLLRRNPIFTLTAALSTGIAIGANTAVFTVANALLFRPPAGVVEPGRVIDLGTTIHGIGFGPSSYANYLDIRQRTTTIDGVYALPLFPQAMSLRIGNGEAERVFMTPVTVNYFTTLGVVPALGRFFDTRDSDAPGASPVMVISYKFWNRRFNRDPEVIGRRLILNGQLFAIVGVAPDGFHGTGVRSGDGWVPLGMGGVTAMNRAGGWLLLGGRLKPGFEIAQAAAEAEAIGRILQQEHPDDNRDKGLAAQTVSPVPGNTGPVAAFMLMLLAIVLIVLTVACANVAGVLLARAAARRTEIAVRLAIGAGRARLIRQLLTETLLLFALGAGVGVGLARITTTVVASQLPQLPFPIELSPSMDYRAITFTIALAMLAAISSGLIPALQSAKTGMTAALKDDARSPQRLRLRHVFIAAQMAFSILLVAVGLLFVRSLQTAGATDPGFDRQGVELSTVDLSQAGYTDAAGRQFVRTLLERVRSLRGIESASIALVLPGGFETHETGVQVPGLVPPNGDSSFGVDANAIAPGYFSTLHIPLISGRDFTDEDRADTEHVAIIGEGLAHQFWPGQNPIGKYVRQPQSGPNGGSSSPRSIQIVGVVRDVKASSLIDGLAESLFYMPLAQHFSPRVTIVTRASQGRVADEVRATVMQMDANLPVATESLEEYSALGLMPQRIARSLASGLGLVGLLLASIGIYGVTAYSVSSRRREFGIRLALGAPRHNVVRMVLGYGLVLAVVGSVTGLMLAAAAGRILTAFMFGAPPVDALMFSAAAALFIAVGLAACLVPALRASTIDPLQALRCD